MRPLLARALAAALLAVAAGTTTWLLVETRGAASHPAFLREQLLVGVWPVLALPLALAGRAPLVLALLFPYVALGLLFGLGIGGVHLSFGIPAYLLALAFLYRDASLSRRPLAASLALASVGLVIAGVFVALSLQCGVMVSDDVRPGEPDAPSRCVGQLHPMSLLLAAGALGSIVALALGRPEVPLTLGIVFALMGIPFVFSAGIWTWLVAFSLIAASMVRWPDPASRPPPSAPAA